MALFNRNDGGRRRDSRPATRRPGPCRSRRSKPISWQACTRSSRSVYDYMFGPTLHAGPAAGAPADGDQPGRPDSRSRRRHRHQPDAVSERLPASPASTCRTRCSRRRTSASREERPAQRPPPADGRLGAQFADDSFDIVYAPYLISVVPDPVAVAREMRRVCRPGGRIIILNHFRSANPILSLGRAPDLAVHRSHRLQVGPRPAGVPRAGRTDAGVDREGQHPADLVAGHLHQGLSRSHRGTASVMGLQGHGDALNRSCNLMSSSRSLHAPLRHPRDPTRRRVRRRRWRSSPVAAAASRRRSSASCQRPPSRSSFEMNSASQPARHLANQHVVLRRNVRVTCRGCAVSLATHSAMIP